MSLRWRWALSLSLVAALAIGLTAWAAGLLAGGQFRGDFDDDLRHRVREVNEEGGILPAFEEGHRGRLRSEVIDLDAVLQLFDPNGTVVLRMGPGAVALPIESIDLTVIDRPGRPVIRSVLVDGVSYRIITAQLQRPIAEYPGAVAFQIAADISRVDTNLAGFNRGLVPIGVIGILLAGITGWILASRAVRPVINLTEAAEEIAATELLDTETRLDRSAPGEIGRLATAFSAMVSALAASRKEQQRLVADAGHEFRTPITALKTNLETLLRQDQSLSHEQRGELLEAAISQSDQLAGLASELVDLATDVHRSEEDLTALDLGEVAHEIADRYRGVGDKQLVVSGLGAIVMGRRSQLERALGNLVDNAVKWSLSRVAIELDGGTVTVSDDGPGIPDQDLPHIFERFYRSTDARGTPGSGLGLAIVQHLIDAHGGEVFARNGPDGGAQVGFDLPNMVE